MSSSTYSFRDLSGAFAHPLAGEFLFAGQQGMSTVTITNATERTTHDVAADGAIMISAIPGDNGSIEIEVQQTSALHSFLLRWFNFIKTNMDLGDVSQWASGTLVLRNIVDGSMHTLTGISPNKVPDKSYAAQGAKVKWTLMAAHVVSV